jgi:hypothetical protein
MARERKFERHLEEGDITPSSSLFFFFLSLSFSSQQQQQHGTHQEKRVQISAV